jgi:hypothetical protein
MYKDREKVLRDNAFREVNRYEPERVVRARKRGGEAAASKMKAAIALDTARAQGCKIPKKPKPKKRR